MDSRGALDQSFANRGWWSDTRAFITGVTLLNGRIVLGAGFGAMGLFQLTHDGERDRALSEDGRAGVAFRFDYAQPAELAVDRRGQIVMAGQLNPQLDYTEDLLVGRYDMSQRTPPDADGDGLTDQSDSCAVHFGSGRTGCPRIKRFIICAPDGDRVQVKVASAAEECTQGAPISIMRATPGPDEEIAHGKTNESGNWIADVRPSARIYGRVAATAIPHLVRCRAARSERVKPSS